VGRRQSGRREPPRRIGLVAFDLDGTLIPKTSVARHLMAGLGRKDEADELERRYLRGEIDQREAARLSGRAFTGLALATVPKRLRALRMIGGLPETLAALKAAKIPTIIATVTWTFAVRHYVERYGFIAHSGTVMRARDGRLTGRIARYCSELDKLDFVRRHARRRGIPMAEVVAVGDARSDLPLFAAAGFAVALNASPDARAAADLCLDTADLRDLLGVLGISC